MVMMLWTVGPCLLMLGGLCSVGSTNTGCIKWYTSKESKEDVCCEICYPGNYLVQKCGPIPRNLCTPCESKTYIKPNEGRCSRCTQCVGAQVEVKECTSTSDTQCGCVKGLTCGDDNCSFCVKKCDRGHEPTEERSCKSCPHGTFNNQTHQKCKPWSTKCPNPDHKIVVKGDALNDIQCGVTPSSVIRPKQLEDGEQSWLLVLSVLTSTVLMASAVIVIIIIIIVTVKIRQKRKTAKKTITKTPIIRTPTDDPQTLIAIECSFHEAEEEQGSSSELLASRPLHGDHGTNGRETG